MKLHYIYIVLTISIGFSFLQARKKSDPSWFNKFRDNPSFYCQDNYEAAVIELFFSQYPGLRLKQISDDSEKICLVLKLKNDIPDYYLYLERTADYKILYGYRHLRETGSEKLSVREEVILKWLGRFLLRMDIGDSEGMYDLVFHEDTRLRYKNLMDKKAIISQLLDDFPKTIQPAGIQIRMDPQSYVVRVTVKLFEEIVLEITNRLAEFTNTDQLQHSFLAKIQNELQAGQMPYNVKSFDSKEAALREAQKYYPNANITQHSLHIPYPKQGINDLKFMQYDIQHGDEQINSYHLIPQISLDTREKMSVLNFNRAYPISIYKSPTTEYYSLDEIEDFIATPYRFILPLELSGLGNFQEKWVGNFIYKGYDEQTFPIKTLKEWDSILNTLRTEGSIYYFPAKIEHDLNQFKVYGLIYIIRDEDLSFYHFGELTCKFTTNNSRYGLQLGLVLYPFLSRIGVRSFTEEQ